MSRLSREKKREQQQAADAASRAAVPVDVRVPADGSDEPGAYVDGVRVIAGPGEEIQQAVLNRLHRIAVASGHAVHATVRDERIGYVVPLRVAPDGSSAFAAQPVQLRGRGREETSVRTESSGIPAAPETPVRPTAERDHAPSPAPASDRERTAPEPSAPARGSDRDRPTHLLRPVPESDAPRTLRLRGTQGCPGRPEHPRPPTPPPRPALRRPPPPAHRPAADAPPPARVGPRHPARHRRATDRRVRTAAGHGRPAAPQRGAHRRARP